MDIESARSASEPTYLHPPHFPSTSLKMEALNLRPQTHHENASAQCTRMIIDSASSTTILHDRPPNDLCHIIPAKDTHGKVPDSAAEADHVLQESKQRESRNCTDSCDAQSERTSAQRRIDDGDASRHEHRQGIVPPYILKSISTSEAAGPQARASAQQTLSFDSIKNTRASNGEIASTANQEDL